MRIVPIRRKFSIPWILVAFFSMLLFSSTSGFAQTLGYSIASDSLVEVDLESGSFTDLGTLGVSDVSGLTMSTDGTLWAVSYFTDDLWSIDPVSVTSTRIGEISVGVDVESGLSMDACDQLWLVTGGMLYEVDPGTAGTTLASALSTEARGLTSQNDSLLALSSPDTDLIEIEPATGTVTFRGTVAALGTQHQGLDFDTQGRLWGVFWDDSPILDPQVSAIHRIDPRDGAVLSTLAVPAADNEPVFRGNLAVAPPLGTCGGPAADIPMSGPPGLTLMMLFLAAAALLVLRRS